MSQPEKPWYTPLLVTYLCDDVPEFVGIPPAALARDRVTLECRVSHEGESFLTKTLPAFGKAFDLALQGFTPLAVSGFKKIRRSALPAFLQALLRRVFKDDGCLVDNPCVKSIIAIRQLCFWCKKVEKGYDEKSLQLSVSEFKKTDSELPHLDLHRDGALLGRARAVVHLILGKCPGLDGLAPAHGPGSVAWGRRAEKLSLSTSYHVLERVFRPIPWFRSLRDASANLDDVLGRDHQYVGFSRLAFVEKDSSGPRLIGLEPAEYMWCQQALKKWLYHHLEQVSPFSKGKINFTDQTINQSFTNDWRTYDTLDMSSASDRVSYELVQFLFSKTKLWPYLQACRVPGILLPQGEVLFYKKFAPMGSAVCFPVEAIAFFALAVAALTLAGHSFLLALKSVFVYGDDLITPHGYFPQLKESFEAVGLKFSEGKCCIHGKFRESCGRDAFDGVEVTPLRLRRPHALNGDRDIVSLIEHQNMLWSKGYRYSADLLKKLVRTRFSAFFRQNRIPTSFLEDLPIPSWRGLFSTTPPRFFTKDSRVFVEGLEFVPTRTDLPAEYEQFCLRVSLSTHGPVGVYRRGCDRTIRSRALVDVYSGSYRKRRLPYVASTFCTLNTRDEPVCGDAHRTRFVRVAVTA